MNRRRRLGLVLALVLSILLLAPACDVEPDRVDSASPDWSRALRVGISTLNNTPALAVDEAGRAHLAWVASSPAGQTLHYVRLSSAGEVEIERDLVDLAFGYPDTPQLLNANAGRLHLTWLTRQATADHPQGFYHVILDINGQVLGSPFYLSDAVDSAVGQGMMCPASEGGAHLFWSEKVGPGANLYGARLDAAGAVQTGPHLLVPGGAAPAAQTDAQGRVHLIWQTQPAAQADRTLYYGVYDPQTGELGAASAVTLVKVGVQNALGGPAVGLTTERVYILWSLEARGRFAGAAQTYYTSWAFDRPPKQIAAPDQLYMPTSFRPEYVPLGSLGLTEGAFNYTQLAAIREGYPGYIMQPSVLLGQHPDLLATLTMNVSTRRKSSQPVALTVFAAGEPQAYQLVTRSDGLSTRSVLRADTSGRLYAIWLHQAGTFNFEVFYASTSPSVRETLNPWTSADLSSRSLDHFWNMGVALGFFPLAMVWVFLSVIWLGLAYLYYGDVELYDRRGWFILIVALLLHFFSKYFSMPGMFTFVPFIETLPDAAVFVIGRVLTPLLFSGVGLVVMIVYLKRTDHREAFAAYVAFALVDIVVSLLIYVPTLLSGNW